VANEQHQIRFPRFPLLERISSMNRVMLKITVHCLLSGCDQYWLFKPKTINIAFVWDFYLV